MAGLCTPLPTLHPALADDGARLGADVGRYSFTVRGLHPLLLAGLPAHSENLHNAGLPHREKIVRLSLKAGRAGVNGIGCPLWLDR
jgi:hypothetical protein